MFSCGLVRKLWSMVTAGQQRETASAVVAGHSRDRSGPGGDALSSWAEKLSAGVGAGGRAHARVAPVSLRQVCRACRSSRWFARAWAVLTVQRELAPARGRLLPVTVVGPALAGAREGTEVTTLDEADKKARLERAREAGLFRYSLVQELAEAGLTSAERGRATPGSPAP